jgi:erythritol transport system substrate-binding protein
MVAQETANWQEPEAFEVTETLLQQFPDVKGIIAGNDTMALGAQAAVNAFNPDIIVVGFDGSDEAMISINKGELDATSLQPVAEMALQSAIQADAYLQAGMTTDLPERQSIDMVLVTPENACDFYQFSPVEPGTSPNCQ